MKYTELKYMLRKNLGNYEHEEFSAVALVEEGESALKCAAQLKDLVKNVIADALEPKVDDISGVKLTGTPEGPSKAPDAVPEEPPKAKRGRKPKAEKVADGEEAVEGPEKVFIAYTRGDTLHKSLVSKWLDGESPTWRLKSGKQVLRASEMMSGKPFLNDDGDIIESFKEAFLEIMKEK